jgi:hypothetical protein
MKMYANRQGENNLVVWIKMDIHGTPPAEVRVYVETHNVKFKLANGNLYSKDSLPVFKFYITETIFNNLSIYMGGFIEDGLGNVWKDAFNFHFEKN